MEFRLVYRGRLPAETSRRGGGQIKMSESKALIRSAFHPQIRDFWQSHPILSVPGNRFTARYTEKSLSFWDYYGDQNKTVSVSNHIHRFAPLITEDSYYGCALDVLFLRRDRPGLPLIHQGDLDNRMKVLFDALKMPKETNEIVDIEQPKGENPCFCLLKDDKYIDHVSITTDRLLTPLLANESVDDVLVVVHVNARVVNSDLDFSPTK